MKKILALAVALVMVMALSVSVFADSVINEGDVVMADSSWWTQLGNDEIGMFDDYSAVSKIVVTCDGHEIFVGYNSVSGEWAQQSGNEVTIDFADVDTDPENAYLCIALSAGDGVEYTVHYVVYGKDGETAPADDNAGEPADTTPEPETTTTPEPETTTTPAPETTTAPATGLALAVVPAVMALAAVAVSKKH